MSNKSPSRTVLVVLVALALGSVAHAALKTLPGHVPGEVANLAPIGRLAPGQQLDLAVGLPLRNQAALNTLLRELQDPSSANYHQYLTPEQFTVQFGPTEQDYDAVIDFVQTNGLAVTHRHGNRVLLDVHGKVSDIERAFHLTLRTYRHPTEDREFYAPDVEPAVAAELPVLEISGLSDYGKTRPMLHQRPVNSLGEPAAGSGPGSGYLGKDFRNAYAPGVNANGFGQMVGLVEFSGYDPDDIFAYEAQAGLPDVPLKNVLLDGSIGDVVASGDAEAEVCLDIEMAMAMATNLAAVVVFEAPFFEAGNAAYWNDVLNAMAASNQIKQFSSSWGFSGSPSQTAEQIFQQMGAQGQTFFQASGDGDAWTSPIFQPSDSTNVTVVGGTTLFMNGAGGGYQGEKVWNWGNIGQAWGPNGITNDFWGSGGGVSSTHTIPYWQATVNMTTNLGSTTLRNVPDVAMTADNVYVSHGSGSAGLYGGTSCAAPLWAGLLALVNQQASGLNNSPAGFVNPAIYAIGQSTNYNACFHDITTGSNAWSGSPSLYSAVPGYDLCTGWGTPAGANLIAALAGGAPDPLVIAPLAGLAANGAAGGPFNGSMQTCTLSNSGAGPLLWGSVEWSLINTSVWISVSQAGGFLAAGSRTNLVVSLTPAANNLAAGIYYATIFFTNQVTHVAQPRICTLQVGQSLVQDGGFESGSFCHWTLAGKTTQNFGAYIFNGVESPHPGYDPVHSGIYGAFLGDSSLAVLYQALPTVPGQKYLLSCWLENPTGGAGEQFQVNWNTNAAATNTIFALSNPPAFGWTNLNFVVAATGAYATLQFGAENQPNYFGLDDVSVTPIPPPVISTLTRTTGGLAFTWQTLANAGYLLQYKTNLAQANWLSLSGPVTATTNTFTQLDTNAFTSSPQRFYRVSVFP